ncbi:hypothetical protein MASR1M60_14170 [Rhodocyclaceae bacterium]
MATANYTLNELRGAHSRVLASLNDDELLELEASSPLEYELMFRLGIMREMFEAADDRANEYEYELKIRQWVDQQAPAA